MNNAEKTKYSDAELKEFEGLIIEKLEKAKGELNYIKQTLGRSVDSDIGEDYENIKMQEDGAGTAEKESLNQLAGRQQKFIVNLENALVRIKNGTYGICTESGNLIGKERLMAVPHTTLSIDSKIKQNS